MRATIVIDRVYDSGPTAMGKTLALSLEGMGLKITRSTAGCIEGELGNQIASGLRLSDGGLIVSATVIGARTSSRLLMTVDPGRPSPLGSPIATSAEQLVAALTVQQRVDADTAGRTRNGPPLPPVLLVPSTKKPFIDALLADPDVHRRVRGQLKVLQIPDLPPQGVVVIDSELGAAQLSTHQLSELLELATYVAGHEDALPDPQQQQAVDLVGQLWLLDRGAQSNPWLDQPAAEIANLIDVQQRLRGSLATRTVMVCRDCRFEKVVNDEYARLSRRNRHLRTAIGVGASALFPSATALTIGGRALGGLTFEPDYVCPRCQGLRAQEVRACICPGCGQLRREVILATCPRVGCAQNLVETTSGHAPLFGGGLPPRSASREATSHAAPRSGQTPVRTALGAWAPDPLGAARYRWHDGQQWTAWVHP
jgi:hypothetical protein